MIVHAVPRVYLSFGKTNVPAILWPSVGRIYKEDHYILLQTIYESSGPCDFGEEDFFMFFPL